MTVALLQNRRIEGTLPYILRGVGWLVLMATAVVLAKY
jgi:hypothetical protein